MSWSASEARRIVIKLGTQVVIDPDGLLAHDRIRQVVGRVAQLWQAGRQPLLVSSGAVGLGRQALQLAHSPREPLTLVEKQACAAVGQTLLMDAYRELFQEHGIVTAQVLLTVADFSDRRRYLTLRQTLEKILALRVVPVINENDVVSTMELADGVYSKSFGDNDRLSALVSAKLDADLLILLTNVEGIYTANPEISPGAQLLRRIDSFEQLTRIRTEGRSALGRGGMGSKIEAARIASISGVDTLVASAMGLDPLAWLLDPGPNDPPGTLVHSRFAIPGRRRWIGFASGSQGSIEVNAGARRALVARHASLLPIGIVSVQGPFQAGQVVALVGEDGIEIGRGVTRFSSDQINQIRGRNSAEIADILGKGVHGEVVHRDNLVIFQEYFESQQSSQEPAPE